ncbi:MAG: hypothetical protein JRI95_13640 [Deltaproteobacteria bacterium]|nr:hypothetical protein [Deltaproteobacteria bacterium]
MARIKIKDLPKDQKISKGEMKKVMGGAFFTSLTQDTKLASWRTIAEANIIDDPRALESGNVLDIPDIA